MVNRTRKKRVECRERKVRHRHHVSGPGLSNAEEMWRLQMQESMEGKNANGNPREKATKV
jgi:hypothetical protein